MKTLHSLALKQEGGLFILNQQKLPHQTEWILISSPQEMIQAIQELKIRGAPLIGISAALSLALSCEQGMSQEVFIETAQKLKSSRPTGIHLTQTINQLLAEKWETHRIVSLAESLFEKDQDQCRKLAEQGSQLIQQGDSLLTYCNTGGLATSGEGTALAVLKEAHKQKKDIHVYVSETRPVLQGGRLSTWELEQAHVPYTLVCDNTQADLMAQKKIDKVFVGADCITKNGDTINKIGTYGLAVLCAYHKIPFYVVAPRTSYSPQHPNGKSIVIEQRSAKEVSDWASSVYNPAFDVTPHSLITGWVFEDAVVNRF